MTTSHVIYRSNTPATVPLVTCQTSGSREFLMDDYKLTELCFPASFGLFALTITVDPDKFPFRGLAKWLSLITLWSCVVSACLTRHMLSRACTTGSDIEAAGRVANPKCKSYCLYYTTALQAIKGLTLGCLIAGICALLVHEG